MTTYSTPYTGTARTEVEVELVSQSGNESVVRYRVFVRRTGITMGFVYWRVWVGSSSAQGIYQPFEIGRFQVKGWTNVTIRHSVAGEGLAPVHAAVRMQYNASLVGAPEVMYPLREGDWPFALPTIERRPTAPGIPTVTIDLREIVAEPAAASPRGAAPVLEYEMQMNIGGIHWFTIQVGARKAVVRTYDYEVLGYTVEFRTRARSVAGWGDWSPVRSLIVPRLLGVRHTDGEDVVCQQAERYFGDGVWTPCTVVERFDGAAWVAPS